MSAAIVKIFEILFKVTGASCGWPMNIIMLHTPQWQKAEKPHFHVKLPVAHRQYLKQMF